MEYANQPKRKDRGQRCIHKQTPKNWWIFYSRSSLCVRREEQHAELMNNLHWQIQPISSHFPLLNNAALLEELRTEAQSIGHLFIFVSLQPCTLAKQTTKWAIQVTTLSIVPSFHPMSATFVLCELNNCEPESQRDIIMSPTHCFPSHSGRRK